MAKKSTIEHHLALLRQLRAGSQTDAALAGLRDILADPRIHGMALKGAADLALKWNARTLADPLRAAAERLAPPDGAKRDPGCEGKQAALTALVEWEADVPDLFLAASQWVQPAPMKSGSVDTAAECRGLAAIGIAQTRPPGAIARLIDLLVDPEAAARARAAQALGVWRGLESIPVLRLKALTGDESAEVLGEVLSSLLHGDSTGEYVDFAAKFLHDDDPKVVEAAALALGESRRPEALTPLTAAWDRLARDPIHTSLLVAIALLRQDPSLDWLLAQLRTVRVPTALEILDALAIYRGDQRAVARISEAAKDREEVAAEFKRLFAARP